MANGRGPALDGQAAGGPGREHSEGETSVQQAARKHGLTVADVEDWQERFLLAAENGLRARPKDQEALALRELKGACPCVSERRLCRVVGVNRARISAVVGAVRYDSSCVMFPPLNCTART
jgi:hypothetical protein